MAAQHFEVDGTFCDGCSELIERQVGSLPGVIVVHADYAHGLASVVFDPDQIAASRIAEEIASAGFRTRMVATVH